MTRAKKSPTRTKPRRVSPPARRVIALTGAHAFLGSELLKRLEEDRRYDKVLAIDIRKPTFPLTKTQFHRLDLTQPTADADLAALLAREEVETFVHAAFLSEPTHHEGYAHELESIGTLHVLNACAEAKIRKLVLSSTTLVYGASPVHPNFLSEDHPRTGSTKVRFIRNLIEAEREVERFAREHPKTIVTTLRAAPTLGPRVSNYATRFFSRPFCPTLMGFDPLLQFVHEDDVTLAFKLACDEDFAGVFNIVGDGVLPYSTVLALLGKVPIPVPHVLAYPLAEALWSLRVIDLPPEFLSFLRFLCVADGSKARTTMGFHPRFDIKATLLDFLGVEAEWTDLASEGGRA